MSAALPYGHQTVWEGRTFRSTVQPSESKPKGKTMNGIINEKAYPVQPVLRPAVQHKIVRARLFAMILQTEGMVYPTPYHQPALPTLAAAS